MHTSHSRSALALAVVCAVATWASAQVRVVAPARPPFTFAAFRVSVEAVVAHVLRFDVDGDGRIRAGELPERMTPLIGRGDRPGDQALDADEVAAVVRNPIPQGRGRIVSTPVRTAQGTSVFRGPPPGGPEGLISDLKLPPDRTEAAKAVLADRKATGPSLAGLVARDVNEATLRKLAGILTDEELADFKAALARQAFLFRGRGAPLPDAPPPPPPRPR